ncbi:hypothetical protein Tco_0383472 [Tanacetum coccineum]
MISNGRSKIVDLNGAEKIPEKGEECLTGLSTAKYLAMQVTCRTLPKILHGYDVEDSKRQETPQHPTDGGCSGCMAHGYGQERWQGIYGDEEKLYDEYEGLWRLVSKDSKDVLVSSLG